MCWCCVWMYVGISVAGLLRNNLILDMRNILEIRNNVLAPIINSADIITVLPTYARFR